MKDKILIGKLENVKLPELGIKQLTVRVDTGAQTSSLHVDNIERVSIKGKPAVAFDIHPEFHDVKKVVRCKAPIHDVRRIKSSNGKSEQRYVIETDMILGERTWKIEVTLTDRSDMTYLMLLGREALSGHFIVDVEETFMASTEGNDE